MNVHLWNNYQVYLMLIQNM